MARRLCQPPEGFERQLRILKTALVMGLKNPGGLTLALVMSEESDWRPELLVGSNLTPSEMCRGRYSLAEESKAHHVLDPALDPALA